MIRLRLVFDNSKYEFIAKCAGQLYRAGMFSSREQVEAFVLPLVKDCYGFEVVK